MRKKETQKKIKINVERFDEHKHTVGMKSKIYVSQKEIIIQAEQNK